MERLKGEVEVEGRRVVYGKARKGDGVKKKDHKRKVGNNTNKIRTK